MPRKRRVKLVSEQLVEFINKSESSRYRISVETWIDAAAIHRFINGGGGLSIASLDRICSYLGLELRQIEKEE